MSLVSCLLVGYIDRAHYLIPQYYLVILHKRFSKAVFLFLVCEDGLLRGFPIPSLVVGVLGFLVWVAFLLCRDGRSGIVAYLSTWFDVGIGGMRMRKHVLSWRQCRVCDLA